MCMAIYQVTSLLYLSRTTDAPYLKEKIRGAFDDITTEMRQNVFYEYPEDDCEQLWTKGSALCLKNLLVFL